MKKLTAGKLILILLIVLLLAIPVLLFPPSQPLDGTGPYPITTARYTYIDEQRIDQYSKVGENRFVNVAFWYPQKMEDAGHYPLVIFSHGGLGTQNSNESLYRELASHGYVVGAIGHPYHAFWVRTEDGRTVFVNWAYFQQIMREDASSDKEQSFQYYQSWMATRTADINFVIDTILTKAAGGGGDVFDQVNTSRIGVMGHSLGGSAALAIPRLRDDIDAVIALESPFLFDIVGVEDNVFLWNAEPYTVPVLNIYSDSAWENLSAWPQYARNAALLTDVTESAPSLHLPGGGHFSLTDLSLVSPLLTRFLEGGQPNRDRTGYLQAVNQACLDFFNRYLKDK